MKGEKLGLEGAVICIYHKKTTEGNFDRSK
jgi:hypothetical protein